MNKKQNTGLLASLRRSFLWTNFIRDEGGNVFFTLFGAVAVVGVLGAGIMATMRGPLKTMVEVNRREQAKAELRVASNLILVASVGDQCGDSDGITEGIAPATGSITGGGEIPGSVSAVKTDPWGNEYAYCAWDHGTDAGSSDGVCTPTANNILAGSTDTNNVAIAVISAGPNGVFDTSCVNHAGGYLTPALSGGDDDIVVTLTYNQAVSGSGGLWGIKSGSPNVAEIDEAIEVKGTGTSEFAGDLQVAATASIITDEIEPINPATQDFVQFGPGGTSGIRVGEVTAAQCGGTPTNDAGIISFNGTSLQYCDGTSFQTLGTALWTPLSATRIHFGNTGTEQVGIGTNNPNDTLDVAGSVDILTTLNVTTNTTMGGNLTINTNRFTVNGTTGDTLIAGTLTGQGDATITGDSADGSTDILQLNDSGSSEVFAVDSDGATNAQGYINTSDMYQMDGSQILYNGGGSVMGTTLLGYLAGSVGTPVTGNNNTILGANTATTLTTGTNNILIGQGIDTAASGTSNTLNIGGAITGNLTSGDVTVAGDLTISGDNFALGTAGDNATGRLMIGQGSNFASIAMNGDAIIDETGLITIQNDAVQFDDIQIGGTMSDEMCLKADGTTGLQWAACGSGSGGDNLADDDFIDLRDTPNAYAGAAADANKVVTVNAAGNGLEFTAPGSLVGLSQDRIEDTGDQNTYIDVDTANDDSLNTISMATAGTERVNISATGLVNIIGNATIGGTLGVTGDAAFDTNTLFVDVSANNVGMGTTSPNAAALLDMTSTTQGLLPPRMTIAQRDLISAVQGLMVFATDAGTSGLFQFYDGTSWVDIGSGSGGSSIWSEDGTNDYIEYDDTLGGVRIGKVTGQPAPAIDWSLDVGNSIVSTTHSVAIGSTTVSDDSGSNTNVVLDLTGDIAATAYCDADGANCFVATDVGGSPTLSLTDANIFVGNGSNVATAVSISGDATLANTGALSISAGVIKPGMLDTVSAAGAGQDEYCLTYEHSSTNFEWATCGGGGGGASELNDLSDAAAVYGAERNIFIGENAGQNATTNTRENIAIGQNALDGNLGINADGNVAIGYSALTSNTGGSNNIAIGPYAMNNNTGGFSNTVVGRSAMFTNSGGDENTALGQEALGANTNGNENTAIGHLALRDNTSGSHNTALGENSLRNNTTGDNNTVIGLEAAGNISLANGDMDNNTIMGYRAGYNFTGGAAGAGPNNNVLFGFQAGDVITTGGNNIIIGYDVDPTGATASNELNIGNTIYGDLSSGRIGIGQVPAAGVELDVLGDIEYTGTLTDVSDRRLKDNITALDTNGSLIEKIVNIDTYSFTMKDDESGKVEFGVMAQELEKIFPELVNTANDEMGTKSVNYIGLIAPMIEATKDVHAENQMLKGELADIKAQVELLNKATADKADKASMLPVNGNAWLYVLLGILGTLCATLLLNRKTVKAK